MGSQWYGVSLVDGYNLPMRINNDKGCPIPHPVLQGYQHVNRLELGTRRCC